MTDGHEETVEQTPRTLSEPSPDLAVGAIMSAAAPDQSVPAPTRGRRKAPRSGSTLADEVSEQPIEVWVLDSFDPTDALPAGFWRYADVVRYVLGRVATGPALNAWRPKELRMGGLTEEGDRTSLRAVWPMERGTPDAAGTWAFGVR